MAQYHVELSNFNPLPPCGGRLFHFRVCSSTSKFQSTPSVWRETLWREYEFHGGRISIHSLRVEGDQVWKTQVLLGLNFNPLPPCGGRPATTFHIIKTFIENFNPLPPCGGRPQWNLPYLTSRVISIHSLRVEGDFFNLIWLSVFFKFQSTPSVWRETWLVKRKIAYPIISIHSLRVEGDLDSLLDF